MAHRFSRTGVGAIVFVALAQVSAPPVGQPPPTDAAPAGVSAPASPPPAGPAETATLKGKVRTPKPRPPSKSRTDYAAPSETTLADAPVAAIWLGTGASPLDPAQTTPVRIRQEGIQFRPGTTIVQTGTPVVFPNSDDVLHAVRSQSAAKKFNVGRFLKGEEPPPIVFDKPGYVFLLCEVHEHMQGHLLVVDTPHHVVSTPEGVFELQGLPPGTHTVTVWRGRKDEEVHEVTLAPGQILEVDWSE